MCWKRVRHNQIKPTENVTGSVQWKQIDPTDKCNWWTEDPTLQIHLKNAVADSVRGLRDRREYRTERAAPGHKLRDERQSEMKARYEIPKKRGGNQAGRKQERTKANAEGGGRSEQWTRYQELRPIEVDRINEKRNDSEIVEYKKSNL